MPSTKTEAAAADAAANQPPRSDAPADAKGPESRGDDDGGANQGSPAAPVMKQFAKTEAESGGNRK